MLELGLKFTLAYFAGGVMGALVMGALRGGIDIRKLGSGNAGGTNALRTQGPAFAAGVMLVDVGKGILAAAVLPGLELPFISTSGAATDAAPNADLLLYAVALGAILGHVFPIWYEFRGGKGGATAAGLVLFLAPGLGAGVVGLWLAIVFFTGYVGLATISATMAAAIWTGIFELEQQPYLFAFAVLVALLTVYTHRANIARMWRGEETHFKRFFGLGAG